MTYEILYDSPSGQVEKVARALETILPPGSVCEALEPGRQPQGEVQLVGFELPVTQRGQILETVAAYLKTLTDKTVLLFATVPLKIEDAYTGRLHKAAAAALPNGCDYRGLHLCPMEPCEKVLGALREHAEQNPDNARAKHWLGRQEQAIGHPDEQDLQKDCAFARHVLKLNN